MRAHAPRRVFRGSGFRGLFVGLGGQGTANFRRLWVTMVMPTVDTKCSQPLLKHRKSPSTRFRKEIDPSMPARNR